VKDSQPEKQRKTRLDKGQVQATRRDLSCLAWIAEQYVARGDQIRRLLSRFRDPKHPYADGELMALTTLKDQINRWRKAGWVNYYRVLADEPGYCWVTKAGLQLVGLDDIYVARQPAGIRLDHLYAVNQVRLGLDQKYPWKSERRYRTEELRKLKKGESLAVIPDGLMTTAEGRIAVEVEMSQKKPAELRAKLQRLIQRLDWNDEGMMRPVFPRIWVYVPSERMERLVASAIADLPKADQRRVAVEVQTDLLASKYRR